MYTPKESTEHQAHASPINLDVSDIPHPQLNHILPHPWNNCFSVLLSLPSDDTVTPQEKMMADNEQLTNESSQNSAVRSQHPSQELPLNRPRSTTPEEVILLMDSNGECIDSKKFCPTKSVKHIFSHCKFYDRNPKQPVLWFAISYCLLHWYKW